MKTTKKYDLSGLSSKTYLTRSQLNKIFDKKLELDEIDELVFSGKLIKRFSYYQPSESLLRELEVIPDSVKVEQKFFGKLAKHDAFVLKEIQKMFSDCNKDTVKLIAELYFKKKYNYYYKNEKLIELLSEGKEEFEI